ncbi:MAG: NAD(+) diphosphatase [Chloroflexi bacterium]|nr:NAD(+) diphosphatase [Chloroflexota bacterium]
MVRSAAQLLVRAGALGHVQWSALPPEASPVFLGIDAAGRAIFVADADQHELEPDLATAFSELRAIGGTLPQGEAALAAQAVALVGWHRRHRFCGACGSETVAEEAGHSRRCTNCGLQHFPRTDPAVIMMILDGDRAVLSKRRGPMRNNVWTALSGFVEPGETPEEAVAREVYEEVGLIVHDVRYFAAQPWPFPASLMLGFYGDADYGPLTVDEELEDARWFTRDELRRAIKLGEITYPPPFSISHFLISGWLNGESSPD